MNTTFLIGAATAAHQVEGNNFHSDYWVQENLPHSSFVEPSGMAVDHYNRYEEDIRLLDNFEWQAGYGKTFGLIAVDRGTQTRYPKQSLSVLGSLR